MCFKSGKSDRRGFKTFLDDHKLPHGLIPWYSGVFIEDLALFIKYLQQGLTCGGLWAGVSANFVSVLG